MSEHTGVMVVLSLALRLASAGLCLWQWSLRKSERERAGAHLERQLREEAGAGAGADMQLWLREAQDPFGHIAAEPPPARAASTDPAWSRWLMPERLRGVVRLSAVMAGVTASVVAVFLAGWVAGPAPAMAMALFCCVIGAFALWTAVQRFRRQLRRQLPMFIDAMVRLITIGNSMHASFQLSVATVEPPLRDCLDRAGSLVRAGTELDEAVQQVADDVRVEEMSLLAAILGLGVRYGGRADLLLERVGNFMRDREQAEQELVALSAETRLSAWILGMLPLGVGLFIVVFNAAYIVNMWQDEVGRYLLYGAAGLQLLGAVLLYRLARLS